MEINYFSRNENMLYELIEVIRPRVAMYVGKHSIREFGAYIHGYAVACDEHNVVNVSSEPLGVFTAWLANRYRITKSYNWISLLLEKNDQDDVAALEAFFKEWDEFCAIDPELLKNDFIDEDGRVILFPPKFWPEEE